MTPDAAREAAELLLAARGDHRKLDRLPESCTPQSVDDAYDIQNALAEAWGLKTVGWKVGAATEAAMAMLGCDEPFPGRVFEPYLLDSPARVDPKALHKLGLEAELAFRLGADLPARPEAYSRDEVAGAVDAAFPAIEIINDYWVDNRALGVTHIIADNGSNGALVLGKAFDDWRERDLAAHRVTLSIEGEKVGEGEGRVVLGHPLNTLVWLANDLSRRGIGMKAGQVVTTGTITGLNFAEAGQTAVADFGDLGTVEVTFAA